MVELFVEITGMSGLVPICIFEDVGGDAVTECNVLGIPGVLLDVADNCIMSIGPSSDGKCRRFEKQQGAAGSPTSNEVFHDEVDTANRKELFELLGVRGVHR
jgi:hypothetical protein